MPPLSLRDLRAHRTRQAVADGLGVALSTYGSWEDGDRSPSPADIGTIGDYYDLSPTQRAAMLESLRTVGRTGVAKLGGVAP